MIQNTLCSKRIISFLLVILQCMCITTASSAETQGNAIRYEEIKALFDRYIEEKSLNPDLISVGYVYTRTGETWYHNADSWYYSASLYKVPLMMLIAEREYNGELSSGSEIYGVSLDRLKEEVLTYSNNELAYSTMLYIAEPSECRRMFQKYSTLPDDYYTWNFYGYSDFTARFMTDVMKTLFDGEEQFPGVIEKLKNAQPGHYFHLNMGDNDLIIAQKYGNYHDQDGSDWNHTSGIIYTPNPFILTVMTRYGGISETIIGDLAILFRDYTFLADARIQDSSDDGMPFP